MAGLPSLKELVESFKTGVMGVTPVEVQQYGGLKADDKDPAAALVTPSLGEIVKFGTQEYVVGKEIASAPIEGKWLTPEEQQAIIQAGITQAQTYDVVYGVKTLNPTHAVKVTADGEMSFGQQWHFADGSEVHFGEDVPTTAMTPKPLTCTNCLSQDLYRDLAAKVVRCAACKHAFSDDFWMNSGMGQQVLAAAELLKRDGGVPGPMRIVCGTCFKFDKMTVSGEQGGTNRCSRCNHGNTFAMRENVSALVQVPQASGFGSSYPKHQFYLTLNASTQILDVQQEMAAQQAEHVQATKTQLKAAEKLAKELAAAQAKYAADMAAAEALAELKHVEGLRPTRARKIRIEE